MEPPTILTDTQARELAAVWCITASWHGGVSLIKLGNTGEIDENCLRELGECKALATRDLRIPREVQEFRALRHYVATHGPRGPVPDWNTLSF